jgi:hypothetical protein
MVLVLDRDWKLLHVLAEACPYVQKIATERFLPAADGPQGIQDVAL